LKEPKASEIIRGICTMAVKLYKNRSFLGYRFFENMEIRKQGAGNDMEKKSKWKLMILPAALFILAFGLYGGYSIWETDNNEDVSKIMDAAAAQSNGNEDVAVFQQESDQKNYRSVGRFISQFHKKYNETLGYGGIDTVKWEEQSKIASEIIAVLANIQTDNQDLLTDFEAISNYSKTIDGGMKDKKALLKLHRYFHDLDIEFNGYSDTNDYFDVTEYKKSENG
jgi:hypothetical protein